MNGLLIGGIIGESLKSFVGSYNAAKDQQRQQAEADEDRAYRRRQMGLMEAKEGVKYDPQTESYSFIDGNGSVQQKRRIESAEKQLNNLRTTFGALTEDQKQGSVEGREMLQNIQALQKRLNDLYSESSGANKPAAVAAPATDPTAIPPEKAMEGSGLSAATLPPAPRLTAKPATKPTGLLDTKPTGMIQAPRPRGTSISLGGLTPAKGYVPKADRDMQKAVQTEVAKKTAMADLPPEVRLKTESAETKQKIALLKDGFAALTPYINEVNSGQRKRYIDPRTPFVGQFVSSTPIDEAQTMMTEAIGRLHSGGAISDDELTTFKSVVPTAADDDAAIERKLNQFQALMRSKLQTFGYTPEQLGLSAPPTINLKKTSQATQSPPKGMVTISNGKETLFVSPADAKEAEKEGFRVIR